MQTVQIIHRTSFTESLVFITKPNRETRHQLSAAGFRWNGVAWWRNRNQTVLIKPKQVETLPVAANDSSPEAASA